MKTACILLLLGFASTTWADESKYLTYDEFVRYIEAGNIKSVTLDNRSGITGSLTDGNASKEFHCYGSSGSSNDPLLNRILKEHGVQVTLQNVSDSGFPSPLWGGFMFLLTPIVGLFLLIVIIMKLNQILENQRSRRAGEGGADVRS
ncbi:MAG: ATP-dependent metallopeptidase FtsH/Yme1/Tma family protein [Candidatus Hydrogenedentes bacterium]|nr:ATP-dependent metallopeptidase FtsH/Yme1/Tma family protein [Candidatus Hydrogenedentota bacterium]